MSDEHKFDDLYWIRRIAYLEDLNKRLRVSIDERNEENGRYIARAIATENSAKKLLRHLELSYVDLNKWRDKYLSIPRWVRWFF